MIRSHLSLGCMALASLLVPAASGIAAEVRLKDGGLRIGNFDSSTNGSLLRLRAGDANSYIVFGVPWDQIAEIRDHNETWLPDRFDDLQTRITEMFQAARVETEGLERVEESQQPIASSRPHWQAPALPGPSEPRDNRVRFIEVDAVAANWDADVEWDGIVLRVWPMNQSGELVTASGTLNVSLFGEPKSDTLQRIGSWTRAMRPQTYGDDGASFRLEFQNFHPERTNAPWHPDQFLGRFGTLHVTVSAPGHGVFRSTVDQVRLRRFSPARDRLFMRDGSRFLSYE